MAERGGPPSGARFARVTELAEGFETAFGLELLATVHWVHKETPGIDEEGVVAAVHGWAPRSRRFTPAQIALASRHLGDRGWLPAETTLWLRQVSGAAPPARSGWPGSLEHRCGPSRRSG